MPLLTPSRRRRILMPLLILLAALVVMYWGSQRSGRMIGEIQRYVQQLADDAAAGRIILDRLNNPNALVAGQTAAAMKEAWAPAMIVSREVVVTAGDNPQFGDGTATHNVMLRVNGRDVLGLRIHHNEEGKPIEILGYWRP